MSVNREERVVFVRGINIYKNDRIAQKEMLELCKKVEGRNLKILKIVKTDDRSRFSIGKIR